MGASNIILVYGTESIPDLDEQYSKWCEDEYIPCLLEDANLRAVIHYQIIKGLSDPTHPGLAEPKGGYPKYLTVYEFESEKSCRAFQNGQAIKKAAEKANQTWTNSEIIVKFQAPYKLRGSWVGQKQAKVGLIHITGVVIPEEANEAFNYYFHNYTIPTLIQNLNLLGADSYQLTGELNPPASPFVLELEETIPKYYNIYKLEGPETFKVYEHSAEMSTNNKNFAKYAEDWPPGTFKVATRVQYAVVKEWVK